MSRVYDEGWENIEDKGEEANYFCVIKDDCLESGFSSAGGWSFQKGCDPVSEIREIEDATQKEVNLIVWVVVRQNNCDSL